MWDAFKGEILNATEECVGERKRSRRGVASEETLRIIEESRTVMIHGLHAVLTAFWQSGTIPSDWKRGLVVPIWKGKGCRQDCNNYRGITLLSVPS